MTNLLQEWVDIQARHRPEAVALVQGDRTMTYGQLDRLSNQLARALRAAGCRRGDRVSLLVPKSPEAIVGMLGTLKADCIYVPVDTANPAARVTKILDACDSRCLLAVSPASGCWTRSSPTRNSGGILASVGWILRRRRGGGSGADSPGMTWSVIRARRSAMKIRGRTPLTSSSPRARPGRPRESSSPTRT